MENKYKHLTHMERDELAALKAEGKSIREIARELKRSPSTISRELNRNTPPVRMRYSALKAQIRAENRLHESRKIERLKSPVLRRYVEKQMKAGWSPERISGRFKWKYGESPISHEAIYQWIYVDTRHLIPFLVRAYKERKRRGYSRKHGGSHHIPERVPISKRPVEVECRAEAGHWEADTVVYRQGRAALQAVVERKTRYTKLTRLKTKTAKAMRVALNRRLSRCPEHILKSITYDNGSENTEHQKTNIVLGTNSFFCTPYHSWERGTVENTIGYVRRFLPKGTNFAKVPDDTIHRIERWLNHRPMKCLGFRTPAEAFSESVALSG